MIASSKHPTDHSHRGPVAAGLRFPSWVRILGKRWILYAAIPLIALILLALCSGCASLGPKPQETVVVPVAPSMTAMSGFLGQVRAFNTTLGQLCQGYPDQIPTAQVAPVVKAQGDAIQKAEDERNIVEQRHAQEMKDLANSLNQKIAAANERADKAEKRTEAAERERDSKGRSALVALMIAGILACSVGIGLAIYGLGIGRGLAYGGGFCSLVCLLYMQCMWLLPWVGGALGAILLADLAWTLFRKQQALQQTVATVEQAKAINPVVKEAIKEAAGYTQTKPVRQMVDSIRTKLLLTTKGAA